MKHFITVLAFIVPYVYGHGSVENFGNVHIDNNIGGAIMTHGQSQVVIDHNIGLGNGMTILTGDSAKAELLNAQKTLVGSQNLISSMGNGLPPQAQAGMNIAQQGLHHAQQMVNNLLGQFQYQSSNQQIQGSAAQIQNTATPKPSAPIVSSTASTSTKPWIVNPVPSANCRDKVVNCASIGPQGCMKYQSWAKLQCPQYCALCVPISTTASTTVKTTQGPALWMPVNLNG